MKTLREVTAPYLVAVIDDNGEFVESFFDEIEAQVYLDKLLAKKAKAAGKNKP